MPSKPLPTDATGKATAIRIHSLAAPHMRNFHLSWLGFFIAFTSWFALSPLLKSTIGPALGLTESDIASSDIANVGSTVIFRLVVGFVTDRVGPRKAMAAILVAGSIPLALTGLVKNAGGLIAIRAAIGLLGATFVPCQYWTTAFFSRNIVGTSNAIVGGWGNMGGGATYLLMPHVYNAILKTGLGANAWKVTLIVPTALCLLTAFICFTFGTDQPEQTLPIAATSDTDSDAEEIVVADPTSPKSEETNKKSIEAHTLSVTATTIPATPESKTRAILRSLATPTILILMLQYACSFGVELAVDSQIGHYLQKTFSGIDQTMAGNLGSIFGLMNFFARATGGVFSDLASKKYGIKGRIAVQASLLLCNGICLMVFSYMNALPSAIAVMIFFSFFCEAACGSTFGIVPYVAEGGMGAASGLVGAGGTIGGFVFNIIFKALVHTPRIGFRVMAGTVLVSAVCSVGMSVKGVYLLGRRK
ncbi:High-affinity nitrate transporter 2.1 [Rhizophlyctis rosea]|uniref:Nitrate/nitrite transporter n=1 Tax=Rhizophlyctis rosea TaxID=64517 RepID=A0AAD5SE23_9FUNG|nr:High-affinity nitrate transporter 2.1 [Rhizophlyctis rosea]